MAFIPKKKYKHCLLCNKLFLPKLRYLYSVNIFNSIVFRTLDLCEFIPALIQTGDLPNKYETFHLQ